MKAIIFARVSTEEQKKEGFSLPAQIIKMREYCNRKVIAIKSEYEVDESSTKDERKKFEEIIEEIRQSKEKIVLVNETIDRLQRSFKESVILDELRKQDKVEIHFLRENLIISVASNSADLLRWDMGVMFARSYVLQLSDNVKRAQEQMLRSRTYPSRPSFGYKRELINKNDKDSKTEIVVDEYASEIVKKAYELYATGAYSLDLLREKLKKDYGVNWSHGWTDKILKDHFYYGIMTWKGKQYAHKYPPLITKALFDQVQQVKASFNKKRFKFAGLPYIYRGLLRCGHCGLSITPEKHKGHVYYHCTQYNGSHNAQWIREEEITNQLGKVFKSLQLPEDTLKQIVEALNTTHQGKMSFRDEQYKKLTNDHDTYSKRIEKLYLDRLDGRITDDEYDKFYQSFREQLSEIDTRLAMLQEAEDNYYVTAKYILDLANRAYDLFISSELEEKRQLIKLVLLNLKLDGKIVHFEANKPFDTLLSYKDYPLMLRG